MVVSSQVVSPSPPPNYQGSILGWIVGESALSKILYWVAYCRANARLLASVQAELAALRAAQPVCDYLSLHLAKEKCLHGMPAQWCSLCGTNWESDPAPYRPPPDFIANQLFKPRKETDCHISTPEELAAFSEDLAHKLIHPVEVRQRKETRTEPHAEENWAAGNSTQRQPIEVPVGPLTKAIAESGRPTALNLYGKLLESSRKETVNRLVTTIKRTPLVLPTISSKDRKKPAPAPFASLWCTTCKDYREQIHECVPALNYVLLNMFLVNWIIEKWQSVLDSVPARTNRESEDALAEKQLTCAQRRYKTVCSMLRKGTISKSAFEATKEHYARLLRAQRPYDDPIVRETLTFVRKQDLELATDF